MLHLEFGQKEKDTSLPSLQCVDNIHIHSRRSQLQHPHPRYPKSENRPFFPLAPLQNHPNTLEQHHIDAHMPCIIHNATRSLRQAHPRTKHFSWAQHDDQSIVDQQAYYYCHNTTSLIPWRASQHHNWVQATQLPGHSASCFLSNATHCTAVWHRLFVDNSSTPTTIV